MKCTCCSRSWIYPFVRLLMRETGSSVFLMTSKRRPESPVSDGTLSAQQPGGNAYHQLKKLVEECRGLN